MTNPVLDVVALSQRVIRCASVTPEDDGAQDVLWDVLEPLGFAMKDYSHNGIRNSVFTLYLNGASAADSGKHLMFAGHTDVVPTGNISDWSAPPFDAVIHDDVLYGRGACDMKTGITSFIAGLAQVLAAEAIAVKATISLLITGDEEAEAEFGTKYVLERLQEEGKIPDAALVGEPTNPKMAGDEIKVGRRGSLTGLIEVSGLQGHVAYPQLADNPLPKLLQLCSALQEEVFDEGNDYFPATNLEFTSIDTGNTADNVIPAQARAQFNVRFNNIWTAPSLQQRINDVLKDVGVKDYTLSCRSNAESFLTQEGAWTRVVSDAVHKVTGRRAALSTKGGTSDARFIAPYCPVVEYGLINSSAHKIDEYMPLSALYEGVEIYAEIVKDFFGTD